MLNGPYFSPNLFNRSVTQAHEQDFQRLSAEMSSGGVSEDYATVQDVKQFLDQEVILEGIQSYRDSNRISRQRIAEMSSVMGTLRDIVNDFQAEISKARGNPLVNVSDFQSWTRDKLGHMNSLLNRTFNGQYLFSGAALNTPAVLDLQKMPTLGLNSPVDDQYYVGSLNNFTFRADDYNIVSANVTGADKGIAELITALRLCANFDPIEADARLARAMDLGAAASTDLIRSGANLDFQIVVLDKVEEALMETEQRLSENIKELGYRSEVQVFQDFIQSKESLALSRYVTTSALNSIRELIDRMP